MPGAASSRAKEHRLAQADIGLDDAAQRIHEPILAPRALSLPAPAQAGGYFICGKPRLTPRWCGSGQRLVITLPRV